MSETKGSKNSRQYEADTLSIRSSRLQSVEAEDTSQEKTRPQKRRSENNPVSGDTVRRIIDRIKGL